MKYTHFILLLAEADYSYWRTRPNTAHGMFVWYFLLLLMKYLITVIFLAYFHSEILSKVKMKNNRDLYLSLFYMPHRNKEDLINLDCSLKKLSNSNKSKHILLAGDFNCPDINWENLTVRSNAPDREIQQALIDITTEHGLTQVHNQPTRQDNILDLVFTNNPSLVKSSTSVPGISDHAMVVTDCDIKPVYNKQNPRKVYLFSKANWEEIYSACENLSVKI